MKGRNWAFPLRPWFCWKSTSELEKRQTKRDGNAKSPAEIIKGERNMVGIICALEIEANKLKSLIETPTITRVGRLEFTSGRLNGQNVVIGMAGVGKVNAAMCAQTMVLKFSPELIINSGAAGSLSSRFSIGDIAVGTGVVEHDFDTTAMGDPIAFFSDLGLDTFPCDAQTAQSILQSAERVGVRAGLAKIASGDQFISDAETKNRLVRLFGGEACEMEGGAIAHVCYCNGVKCAVIRAISDSTDGLHQMEFSEFLPMAAENSANVVLEFLRSM